MCGTDSHFNSIGKTLPDISENVHYSLRPPQALFVTSSDAAPMGERKFYDTLDGPRIG